MQKLRHMLSGTAAVMTLAAAGSDACAHHAGGIGNAQGAGPINTISASTLEQGHGVAGITVDYSKFGGLSDENLLTAGEGVHDLRTIQSYALGFAYGLTDDLMLSVRLPYVRRTGIREAEGTPPDVEAFGAADGLGDLSVLGQYRFLRQGALEAAALIGVKAPTGSTDERTLAGEIFDAEFQPGSGSWDGIFGLAVTRRLHAWSLDGNVLYTLATRGAQDTDLGDRLQVNAAVSYRLVGMAHGEVPMFHGAVSHDEDDDGHHLSDGHRHAPAGANAPAVDLVLELNGEWHAKEEMQGAADQNSGGTTLHLSPGLRVALEDWSSFVSVGIPVANDLNGVQSAPGWRLSSGMFVSF